MAAGIPRPDEWPEIRMDKGGVPESRRETLWGPQVESRKSPEAVQGLEALDALRAALIKNVYRSEALFRRAMPRIAGGPYSLLERAVVVRLSDGTFVPLAHVGPHGWWLLDREEAVASMRSREGQVAPAGGFAGQGGPLSGVSAAVTKGAEDILGMTNHPVAKTAMTLASIGLTAHTVWQLYKRYARGGRRR